MSEGDLQDIHLATLEVWSARAWVEAQDARDVFGDGGCRVDRDGHGPPPAHVVEDAIRSAHRWSGGAAGTHHDIMLGGGRLAFMNFGEALGQRSASGENRPAVDRDVADICTVVDWAGDIDVYEAAITPVMPRGARHRPSSGGGAPAHDQADDVRALSKARAAGVPRPGRRRSPAARSAARAAVPGLGDVLLSPLQLTGRVPMSASSPPATGCR